jgi:TonB family protein
MEGIVVAQVRIGTDGLPKECRILVASGHPPLDNGTCERMMTMRFAPAFSAAGKPIENSFRLTFNWLLADRRAFGPTWLEAKLTVAAGARTSCTVSGAGALFQAWSKAACTSFGNLYYYLGDKQFTATHATIRVKLDAPDASPAAESDAGAAAIQRIAFALTRNGEPIQCRKVLERGFGRPLLNYLSPCGPFIAGTWFAKGKRGEPVRTGVIETTVYLPTAAVQ